MVRVAILGVGDETIPHDVHGMRVLRALKRLAKDHDDIAFIECGVVPENFLGLLRELSPELVVIIDAVSPASGDVQVPEGAQAVRVIDRDSVGGISFSTHALPLTVFLDYIETTMGAKTLLIGVTGPLGKGLDVHASAEKVLTLIAEHR